MISRFIVFRTHPILAVITHFFLYCSVWMLACGCGKGRSNEVSDSVGAGMQPNAQLSPTPQPVASTAVQPVVIPAGADASAALAQLTQAVRKYGMDRRQVPKSISEVIAAGYIKDMPEPPPGKQFAIDAKQLQVILVNR